MNLMYDMKQKKKRSMYKTCNTKMSVKGMKVVIKGKIDRGRE